MCFSAEASFTAAGLLSIVGYGTLKNGLKFKPYLWLSLIPLMFAVQQFSEGVLWVILKNGDYPSLLGITAQSVFLLFAIFIWPIWVPLSLGVAETVRWRKAVIYAALACGGLWSGACLLALAQTHVTAQIQGRHILYLYQTHYPAEIYGALIIIPCFVSSLKKIWIFGLLVVVSAYLTAYFYFSTFTSVWCFFSAAISLFLYKVLRDNILESEPSHV